MARIRSIKPEFFRHEELQDLGAEAMLVFAGLWTQCDSKGRFQWKPRQLKLDILPFMKFDMEAVLEKLRKGGFLIRYKVNEKLYGCVPTFREHQRISGKELTDGEKYPDPIENEVGSNGEALEKQQGSNRDQQESQEREREREREKERNNILSGKEPPDIPYQEIISYLNQKTGKHFEHESKQTRARIKARWGSNGKKRTLQDFITVIDNKCRSWLNDPEMAAYLRPETLFGTKFESYLNEINHPLSGKVSDKTIQNVEMLKEWRPPT